MKRFLDILLSLFFLIFLTVIFVLLTPKGSVFYVSDRARKENIVFKIQKFVFDIIAVLNFKIRYKINKLLGDECYSSAKLEALGFKAQKTLKDMNETDF